MHDIKQLAKAAAVAGFQVIGDRIESPYIEGVDLAPLIQRLVGLLSPAASVERCNCCGYLVTQSEHRGCLFAGKRPVPSAEPAPLPGKEPEVWKRLQALKNPYPFYTAHQPDRALLRRVVDAAWSSAKESNEVPATDWADRIIDGALSAETKPQPDRVAELEAEVERLNIERGLLRKAYRATVGFQAEQLVYLSRYVQRLRGTLRAVLIQNDNDMLLTGDEIREARAELDGKEVQS